MKQYLKRSTFFLGITLLVAACTNFTEKSDVVVICPEVNVIRDTDRMTRFVDGPGKDITDIVYEADLRRAGGLCEVKSDEVKVYLNLDINIFKGAANQSNSADLGVNIGIYDNERKLIAPAPVGLRQLPITVNFADNNPLAQYSELVTVIIPKTEEEYAEDFQIFVSLDMTKEEYQFNQNNR